VSRPAGKKLVLLGMTTRMPVGGVVWQVLHYLIGFQRLGYEVYYVETHGRPPFMLMEHERDHSSEKAAAFIDRVMRRIDLGDRWAYFALHHDSHCYGMSKERVAELYRSASLIVNLHGGTKPTPELAGTGRLVYLETDPVELQVELHDDLETTLDTLEAHSAFFTFGENYGRPDCKLPVNERFAFHPTRQPVVMDFWSGREAKADPVSFTTVGNWKQPWRDVIFQGEVYGWSKHNEFLKFIDLPSHTSQPIELALASFDDEDRLMLESKGWRVRRALDFSMDADSSRDYIVSSRGEFTAAKDQNVRLRTGWFSDRSTTYLAAGRPVICQQTGFSNIFPTGEGLHGFSNMEEIVEAIERTNADYALHSRRAIELAREYFSHEVVLGRLLAEIGEEIPGRRGRLQPRGVEPFPADMVIAPMSRRPMRLPEATVRTVLSRPVPAVPGAAQPARGRLASIVIVTYDNLVFTRLALETLLANTDLPYEAIVVDNASRDGTSEYLRDLAAQCPRVRLVLNRRNAGFARACNQGLAMARGNILVLLNNDTMVPPGWLTRLALKLESPDVGLVGAITNRIGNEAEVDASYETWGQCLDLSRKLAAEHDGLTFEIPTVTMFCLAMRRDAYDRIGPLDTQFEVGTLEDDDYSIRTHEAGYRTICADDAFVHHFGEASFGKLVPTGEYARVLEQNKARFERKWGTPWRSYGRRRSARYEGLTQRIREIVADKLPPGTTLLVLSRGDEGLVTFEGRQGRHFPATEEGLWVGHNPANSEEAVALLEKAREQGGQFLVVPETGFWWLDYYEGFGRHLTERYPTVVRDEDTCVIFSLDGQE
jgi:GT2 family glycosyltransferase